MEEQLTLQLTFKLGLVLTGFQTTWPWSLTTDLYLLQLLTKFFFLKYSPLFLYQTMLVLVTYPLVLLSPLTKSLEQAPFITCIFCLSFSSFSFVFAGVIDHLLGLLEVQKILRKLHWDGNFYHRVATCGRGKFCSEFFTQRFEYFIHISGSIDLGIIRKIFFSCTGWA